jgi:hypothetical protein
MRVRSLMTSGSPVGSMYDRDAGCLPIEPASVIKSSESRLRAGDLGRGDLRVATGGTKGCRLTQPTTLVHSSP